MQGFAFWGLKKQNLIFRPPLPETGRFLQPMAVAVQCPLHVEFAGGGRPQVLTSCEMNDRPAELSEIQGC